MTFRKKDNGLKVFLPFEYSRNCTYFHHLEILKLNLSKMYVVKIMAHFNFYL